MMEIGAGLTAAKTGLDLIKHVRDLTKKEKLDPQEISASLLELQGLLLEARQALADADEQNRELRRKLAEEQSRGNQLTDMEHVEDGGFYIRKSDELAGKHIAYCPLCWTKDGKAVALNANGEGYYRCDFDQSTYRTRQNRQQQQIALSKSYSYRGGSNSWLSR